MTSAESPLPSITCNHQTETEEGTLYNNCRNDKNMGSEEIKIGQWVSATIPSLHYALQLSSREQQCCSPSFLPHFLRRNGWRFIRPLHTDIKSPALHREVWRYWSFLLALLGVRFSTGVKQHSVMPNGNMLIYITCGFCSFVSYISVLSLFQSPP